MRYSLAFEVPRSVAIRYKANTAAEEPPLSLSRLQQPAKVDGYDGIIAYKTKTHQFLRGVAPAPKANCQTTV